MARLKKAIVHWLLRRLGYPTHRLVYDAPSMLAVIDSFGVIVYTTFSNKHLARAKCREMVARGNRARVVLYRAVTEEPF